MSSSKLSNSSTALSTVGGPARAGAPLLGWPAAAPLPGMRERPHEAAAASGSACGSSALRPARLLPEGRLLPDGRLLEADKLPPGIPPPPCRLLDGRLLASAEATDAASDLLAGGGKPPPSMPPSPTGSEPIAPLLRPEGGGKPPGAPPEPKPATTSAARPSTEAAVAGAWDAGGCMAAAGGLLDGAWDCGSSLLGRLRAASARVGATKLDVGGGSPPPRPEIALAAGRPLSGRPRTVAAVRGTAGAALPRAEATVLAAGKAAAAAALVAEDTGLATSAGVATLGDARSLAAALGGGTSLGWGLALRAAALIEGSSVTAAALSFSRFCFSFSFFSSSSFSALLFFLSGVFSAALTGSTGASTGGSSPPSWSSRPSSS
mmetsp:Transcript_42524/g.85289  ORF Transcript_42524/g.85289 Transcript_42524/m.85289 type:complete len:377 (+) Transcript_42524:927-2057(+)